MPISVDCFHSSPTSNVRVLVAAAAKPGNASVLAKVINGPRLRRFDDWEGVFKAFEFDDVISVRAERFRQQKQRSAGGCIESTPLVPTRSSSVRERVVDYTAVTLAAFFPLGWQVSLHEQPLLEDAPRCRKRCVQGRSLRDLCHLCLGHLEAEPSLVIRMRNYGRKGGEFVKDLAGKFNSKRQLDQLDCVAHFGVNLMACVDTATSANDRSAHQQITCRTQDGTFVRLWSCGEYRQAPGVPHHVTQRRERADCQVGGPVCGFTRLANFSCIPAEVYARSAARRYASALHRPPTECRG